MSDIFQLDATVSKVTSMSNRSLRVQVDTQENLADESMAKVMALLDKYGHFVFLPDTRPIDEMDLLTIPPLKAREDIKQSSSQRLRGVLYVLWKQKGEQGEFENYYHSKMEKFISAVKDNLT